MFVVLSGLEHTYMIGVGRADCTGPPAEIPLVSKHTDAAFRASGHAASDKTLRCPCNNKVMLT